MAGVFARYSVECDDILTIGMMNDEIDKDEYSTYITLLASDQLTLFDNLREVLMENEVMVKAPNTFSNTKKDIRAYLMEAYYRTYPNTRPTPVVIDADDEGIETEGYDWISVY